MFFVFVFVVILIYSTSSIYIYIVFLVSPVIATSLGRKTAEATSDILTVCLLQKVGGGGAKMDDMETETTTGTGEN